MQFDPALDLGNQNGNWWTANGSVVTTSVIGEVAEQPRYFIEFIRYVSDSPVVGQASNITGKYYYRITTRGLGATTGAEVVLQSTYSRRF